MARPGATFSSSRVAAVICNVEVAIVYYKCVAMESGVERVGGQRHVRVGTMLDLSGE